MSVDRGGAIKHSFTGSDGLTAIIKTLKTMTFSEFPMAINAKWVYLHRERRSEPLKPMSD